MQRYAPRSVFVFVTSILLTVCALALRAQTNALLRPTPRRILEGPIGFTASIPANFQVRPLPGHPAFVFSMYGAPAELEPLSQVVQVMREQHLGNGFDPGPTPHPNAKPIFDYLAGVGWPVMCYPGCADMQIKGGRCVLTAEDEAALGAMDRSGIFTAVQLGEWGYYFHNLATNESWWRDVYGKEFDNLYPSNLSGYALRSALPKKQS